MKRITRSNARMITVYIMLIAFTTLLFQGCPYPDIIEPETFTDPVATGIEITEEPITETGKDPETDTGEDQKITEEILQMELKAFEEFDHYYVTDLGRVFGVTGGELNPVVFKDQNDQPVFPSDFFVIDGVKYLNFIRIEKGPAIPETDPVQYEAVEKEYYFSQENGKVKTLSELPEAPEQKKVTLDEKPFQIVSDTYEGDSISKVYNGTRVVAYCPIISAFTTGSGLWYYTPEILYGIRFAGLYHWKTDDKGPRLMANAETGTLW